MSVTVRPVARADIARVLALWTALNENGADADARWRMAPGADALMLRWAPEIWLLREPFPQGWVAERDGELVGFLEGQPLHTSPVLEQPRTALIANLYVDPSARRQGVGRTLVETFARAAASAGHPALEVGTLTADERAVAFWRGLGFGDWRVVLRRE